MVPVIVFQVDPGHIELDQVAAAMVQPPHTEAEVAEMLEGGWGYRMVT